LGLGSIGTFAAHTLAEIPARPPVTLLLHRQSLLDGYIQNGKKLMLETHKGDIIDRRGYEFEVLQEDKWHKIDAESPTSKLSTIAQPDPLESSIEHLIVCVKSTQTVAALRPLLPRLSHKSTIMFLQNGAGMIEDVNESLWKDSSTRPNYITGVISHGVTLKAPFSIKHTGPAATSIGPVPRDDASNSTASTSAYLLDALPLAPQFNCSSYAWPDILQRQLEKLAVNAFSNPLTALADSTVEYLFTIPDVCRALMEEISSVVLALPELQGVPGVSERFSANKLEATVMEVIKQNRKTTCSMVWDMRARRETEIRFINGYWARRGEEVGVPTPINAEIVARIQAMTAERRSSRNRQT
jgi:2-dehydropantoate 2-reductase